MSENPITDELLESYWRDGYAVVPGLLDETRVARWKKRLDEILSGEVPPSKGMLVMKDVMVAKGAVTPGSQSEAIAKIQDYEEDEELYSYVDDSDLLDCVERFIGHDVFTLHTMLINKPPNVDGRHPLHQDLLYFPFRPADKIVASWTALERVTKENGCLVVVPGSHRGELLPHENVDWEYVNAAYFGAKGVDEGTKRVHLEMEPGDTVFFHPILIHGSGRNRTQGFRRAISAHYASMECSWEWSVQEFTSRKYKIVRGENAGGIWDGSRSTENPINPLEFVPYKDEMEGIASRMRKRNGEEK